VSRVIREGAYASWGGGKRSRGGNTAGIGARSGKARSHMGDMDV
jgi:hypothetical protein